MKFIDKLERKFGNRGIENLTIYIIVSYVLGYALKMLNPGVLGWLSLDVSKILQGQIWRLITWVIYPPDFPSLFWFAIAIIFFYYPISNSLEKTWGSFRFTLYIFSGIIFTVLAAFILYFITGGYVEVGNIIYVLGGDIFSTMYISMSIFLAYALTYPNNQVLLMFVIPIRMKWMAYAYVVMIALEMIQYLRNGYWFMLFPIVASLLNFIIFFLGTRNLNRYNPKEIHRRNQFKRAMGESKTVPFPGNTQGVTKHKCAVCGRTEKDDPNLEFRFCSKCNGNYEYCQDHLYTHIHKK